MIKKIFTTALVFFLSTSFCFGASTKAKRIRTDTSNFNRGLSPSDDNVQKALDSLDDKTAVLGVAQTFTEPNTFNAGTNVQSSLITDATSVGNNALVHEWYVDGTRQAFYGNFGGFPGFLGDNMIFFATSGANFILLNASGNTAQYSSIGGHVFTGISSFTNGASLAGSFLFFDTDLNSFIFSSANDAIDFAINSNAEISITADQILFNAGINNPVFNWATNNLLRLTSGNFQADNDIDVLGNLQADDYFSGLGNQGITNDTAFWLCTSADCSTTCQVTIEDGLIVGCP